MIDKRIKMECPFCHTPPSEIQIKAVGFPKTVYAEIYCPKCGCKFTGTGTQELIDKWNCR